MRFDCVLDCLTGFDAMEQRGDCRKDIVGRKIVHAAVVRKWAHAFTTWRTIKLIEKIDRMRGVIVAPTRIDWPEK